MIYISLIETLAWNVIYLEMMCHAKKNQYYKLLPREFHLKKYVCVDNDYNLKSI